MKKYSLQIPIIFILVIVWTISSYVPKSHSQEVTKMMNGVVWRRIHTCKLTEALEAGNKVKRNVNGKWVYVQKLKAKDYIPSGEVLPLQTEEDKDRDSNTDYVVIRIDTRERIAKKIEPKDAYFADDAIYE